MDIETVTQHAWTRHNPQRIWNEHLKINGGAAHLEITLDLFDPMKTKAVLSLWTLERGYQPFVTLAHPDLQKQPLEVIRQQVLDATAELLKFKLKRA